MTDSKTVKSKQAPYRPRVEANINRKYRGADSVRNRVSVHPFPPRFKTVDRTEEDLAVQWAREVRTAPAPVVTRVRAVARLDLEVHLHGLTLVVTR